MLKIKRSSSGFTLIELLVVMVVIGLLVGILLPNMLDMRLRSRDARVKSELRALKTALEVYYQENQDYPADKGAIGGDGGTFTASGVIYMQTLPESFEYTRVSQDSFLLYAPLENLSDQDVADSQNRCGVSVSTNNYYECTL